VCKPLQAASKPKIQHCVHQHITEPCCAPAKYNLHSQNPVLKMYVNIIPKCVYKSLKIPLSLRFSYECCVYLFFSLCMMLVPHLPTLF
jgi:hypothetical protein